MKQERKIVENYRVPYMVLENLLILAQILSGGYLLAGISVFGLPVLSVTYAVFAFAMLFFVLRKTLCTGCSYYGKSCHCGWGRLAARLYPEGSGNRERGGKLAGMTWMLLMLVPLLGGTAWTLADFSGGRLLFLGAFLVLSAVNAALHVKDCSECAMRESCPGSAWKPEK